jgi:hypothetical protein
MSASGAYTSFLLICLTSAKEAPPEVKKALSFLRENETEWNKNQHCIDFCSHQVFSPLFRAYSEALTTEGTQYIFNE